MPLPIVTSVRAINRNGSIVISKTDSVRIEAKLSDNKGVRGLKLEYFYDNLEKEGETKVQQEMTLSSGVWEHFAQENRPHTGALPVASRLRQGIGDHLPKAKRPVQVARLFRDAAFDRL